MTRKSLNTVAIFIALPLILEFAVAWPLLALHAIGGAVYMALGAIITITGIVGTVLGISASALLLMKAKVYFTNQSTKNISSAIIALTVVCLVVIGLIAYNVSVMNAL